MWKTIYDSVQGSSHKTAGLPCQDACRVFEHTGSPYPLLVVACADGAGSASHSDLGAQAACDSFVRAFDYGIPDGLFDAARTDGAVREICKGLRKELENLSASQQLEVRDVACTFLAAAILDSHAVFFQIGDGAIVVREFDGYKPVFWPQSGEYLNTTNFLSDADYLEKVVVQVVVGVVDEFAVFTDGMERLALRTSDRTAHEPFFRPMFESLRAASNVDDLFEPLRQFLDSERVNERTDDDKTLILATRRPSGQGHNEPIL
jgi:Protein phosphatase 2C